jgi:hypothetical protein
MTGKGAPYGCRGAAYVAGAFIHGAVYSVMRGPVRYRASERRQQTRDRNMAKIESLHGTTPAEIFHSGLENLDGIASVAVSVLWTDGTVTAGWSNADAAQVALLILALDEEQRRAHFPPPG